MTNAGGNRDLQYEIEQFLYEEAALLDEGRFLEWLDLFTDDVHYWMPVRETLQTHADGLHPEDELSVPVIDDDKRFLRLRIDRLATGLAHAEVPLSRTRHLITNVRVRHAGEDEFDVFSNFHLYQGRAESVDYEFFGRREDRFRRICGEWKIARRRIVLDHTVLPRTVSVFF